MNGYQNDQSRSYPMLYKERYFTKKRSQNVLVMPKLKWVIWMWMVSKIINQIQNPFVNDRPKRPFPQKQTEKRKKKKTLRNVQNGGKRLIMGPWMNGQNWFRHGLMLMTGLMGRWEEAKQWQDSVKTKKSKMRNSNSNPILTKL